MGNDPVGDLVFPTLAAWIAMGLGRSVAVGRARFHGALAQTRAEEQRLEAERGRIVAAERQRIVRELHDIVAQTVSAMQIQLSAARSLLTGPTPEAAVSELLTVEGSAREATAELRRMLGLLRRDMSEGSVLADVPSDDAPDDLTSWPGGEEIDVRIDPQLTGLPAGLQVALYRLLAIAVQDARAGSGATRGHIDVAVAAGRLCIEVHHDGPGSPAAVAAFCERAVMFGGQPELHDGAGRTIRVALPVPIAAAEMPV